MNKNLKICFFGIYRPEYSRNRILISGFKMNGVQVIECKTEKKGLSKYIDLIKKHRKIADQYDIMIVGFPGWLPTILAKFLTRKPIIFDAYLSLYNAVVFDRKDCSPRDPRAVYYWLLDWLASLLADRVLLDTNAHIKYFIEHFRIKKEKFIRVLIGADDAIFQPIDVGGEVEKDKFIVGFHGNFIPVQGVRYIIRAAEILNDRQDIKFVFIGTGQEYKETVEYAEKKGLKNVEFWGRKPYLEMPKYIAGFDVGLGNFGDTPKTPLVVANKTYEINAMRIAHISADAPAMRELYIDRENVLFCQAADPKDLAKKIVELRNNPRLKKKIAENAFQLFKRTATPQVIIKAFIKDLNID